MSEHSPIHRPPVGGEYYVFRDPVHNLIEIDNDHEGKLVRRILRTREVQRLRFISQNGLGRFVYQGLEGTRFPHSLGAYHIARRIIRSLYSRQPSECELPSRLRITERDLVSFPIAALLHDLGHGPLSHIWEQYLSQDLFPQYNHEVMSCAIIKSPHTEIGLFLGKHIETEFPQYSTLQEDVLSFLEGSHRLYYLIPLLSGNLDVDRLDFMSRDTRGAGVTYGFHDLDWIIRSFRLARLTPELIRNDAATSAIPQESFVPFWTIAIDGRKGLSTLIQFLQARENMYYLVYLHKTVRSASVMLQNLLIRAAKSLRSGTKIPILNPCMRKFLLGRRLTAKELTSMDDNTIWEQIKLLSTTKCRDEVLRSLSGDMLSRKYFKVFTLRKSTYEAIRNISSSTPSYISSIIAAKTGFSLEESDSLYGFDMASFNRVGRIPDTLHKNVWIMKEGIDDHTFTSLHNYFSDKMDGVEEELYFLAVDESVVEEVNLIVERLSRAASAISPESSEVSLTPGNYQLVAALGKEGAWKSAYIGVAINPGAEDTIVVALKSYKEVEGIADAIKREIIQINLLLDGIDGREYLSMGRHLGACGDRQWLAERLWSTSLHDLVTQIGPLRDVYEIARLAHDLSKGLSALHSKSIRHTDVKPDNCGVLRIRGRVDRYLLGDFGCATTSADQTPADKRLEGTQRTRAPETFVDRRFSLQGDVWALGATIYSLIAKRYPFMDFETPHESTEERQRREAETAAEMDTLLPSFRSDLEKNVPPIILSALAPCFEDFGKRTSAAAIADAFSAVTKRLDEMQPSEREMARGAWRVAEDLLSQNTIVGKIAATMNRDQIATWEAYIPPSLLDKFPR